MCRKGLIFLCLLLLSMMAQAQPVLQLKESRISVRSARARHLLPHYGLPMRSDGQMDGFIRLQQGRWQGADTREDAPKWYALDLHPDSLRCPEALIPVWEEARRWASEKPLSPTTVVYGPRKDGWFLALCRRTQSALGWKSIAFLVPAAGCPPGSVYQVSVSVNRIESLTGYNLFTTLPSHLQEIVEEMTSAELFCPFQEFDSQELPERDLELEFEVEHDDGLDQW